MMYRCWLVLVLFGLVTPSFAADVIATGSSWKFLRGTNEASLPDPTAWRQRTFNDSAFATAPAPFWYGDVLPGGTQLTDMQNVYTCIFLRRTFTLTNVADLQAFQFGAFCDDGFIAWLNGVEIVRYNVAAGEPTRSTLAIGSIAEPAPFVTYTVTNPIPASFAVNGTNVLAIQVFNSTIGSSDLGFDCTLATVVDDPPTVAELFPPAGSTTPTLRQIDVVFSESVTGVDAADLRINGSPATNVISSSPRDYRFQFPSPPTGAVQVAWATSTGIRDLAANPHTFAGGSWTYQLDPNALPPSLVLNEIMADNSKGTNDIDGDTSDWIEILNASGTVASLSGWFLTDDPGNLTKWRFPSVNLGPNGYLLVWASEKNRTNPAAQLHTNFKLEKGGEFLALVNPNTNIASAFIPIYPPQQTDASYGRLVGALGTVGFFATPTPGRQNSSSGPGFSPEVRFSPAGGIYTNNVSISLNAGAGIPVRYTLDGTEPTATSPLYSAPISLINSTVLKARAFQAGLLPGVSSVHTYTLLGTDMLAFTSPLPLVVIDAFGNTGINNNDGIKRNVSMTFIEESSTSGRSHILGPVQTQVRAAIEVRGSSSAGFPKKSYSVELRDGAGDDLPASLLGMPAESDWVLYAPYTDKTFMNDFLAYELHEAMGHYAVRRRHVEVFLDTSGGRLGYGDYIGVYVLLEKIKIDKNRVNIAQLTPQTATEPDISGGYILKRDRLEDADDVPVSATNGFGSTITLGIEDPKKHELSTAQINWIQAWLNQIGAALAPANFATTKAYTNYLDPDSFIDNQWMVEFAKNIDGYRLSNFFHKDRGGRLKMDPIWDWNLSFGNADYADGEATANWYYPIVDDANYPWMRRLFQDPDFNQRYIDRWGELRTNLFKPSLLQARIDRIASRLSEPASRDYQRWTRMGQYIWPNPPGIVPITTFAGMTTWIKNWSSNRFNWIETQFAAPPTLSHPGGDITPGLVLTMLAPAGSIYYTTDGTDPRLPGGNPAGSARVYTAPVTITNNARIFARARNGTAWSPPVAATYVVATPPLRITEINYHPAPPPAGNTNDADNFEFVEVRNIGSSPLNLSRFQLRGGVDFIFPNVTLAAGEAGVVVRHAAAFAARYGATPRILGTYSGQLDNDGEHLVLQGPVGEPILDFSYQDQWYPVTDGPGFSLVVIDPAATVSAWDTKHGWRPSARPHGSPGLDDAESRSVPPVVISEVLAHTDLPAVDQIELFNPTAASVDLGGWFLTDTFNEPMKFRLPPGTTIAAGGYLVFGEGDFNTGTSGNVPFSLSSRGDDIYLFSGEAATTNLTGYMHGFDFGAQVNGVTLGRYVISSGQDHLVTQSAPTLGSGNAGPLVGPIVISEVMYHPPDLSSLGYVLDNTDDEFIELRNITGSAVGLFDPLNPANTWRLRDAVSFRFPTNVTLPAGGHLLVVGFDPSDPSLLSGFRTRNNVAVTVPIYGPFDGKLDNSSDSVELVRPDLPQVAPAPDAGSVPYVLVDKVAYEDALPWPPAGDGFGPSLQRLVIGSYGNDPTNWTAAARTPGRAFSGGNPPVITQQPTNRTVFVSSTVTLQVNVSGTGPFSYQWRYDGANLPNATNASLILPNIQAAQSGAYQVIVLNNAGSAASTPAVLTVVVGAVITLQPKAIVLRGSSAEANFGETGTNATFQVSATGKPPFRYQWRRNEIPVPNATNATYTINQVNISHDGLYDVVVRDATSEVISFAVSLTVLVSPSLVQGPANLTVTEGANLYLSAEMRAHPAPYTFSWRRATPSAIYGVNTQPIPRDFFTLNTTAAGMTLAPGMLSTNINCRLVLSNSATSLGTAHNFVVTVLADRDGDGMADEWEQRVGLNPASAADAAIDTDGDRMSNRAEYIAGTDPNDPASYLRVEPNVLTGTAAIEFQAVSNRTYTVEFTDLLGNGVWQKLTDVLARPVTGTERIPDPDWTERRYYRVLTPYRP